MSERSGGFGAFLLGIVLGAVAGFVFAPTEGGETTRRKVSKGLRNLKELAEDKVDEVRGLKGSRSGSRVRRGRSRRRRGGGDHDARAVASAPRGRAPPP